MTRFASIMGVAAVATLVLLSGCETPMKTDYAKDLEGTWKVTLMRDLANPLGTPPTVPGTTDVTAQVKRTETNKGTVSISIADTLPGSPAPAANTAVMGNIEVTSSKITVTVTSIMVTKGGVEVPATALPEAVQGLAAAPQEIDYDLMGDKLKISSPLLGVLLEDPMTTTLEFAKEMASN